MKVLITANLTESGINRLKKYMDVEYKSWKETKKIYFGEEFVEKIKRAGADALIVEVDLVHEEVIENCDLKFIGCCRADPLNISVDSATKKGIPVFYTPGRNAHSVADLTVALILLKLRPILELNSILKSKKLSFENIDEYIEYYDRFRGYELYNKKVGIIGFGAIGYQVAKRLSGFGCEIFVYDPYVKEEKLKDGNFKKVSLEYLVSNSDIITIHASLTPETEKLVGEREISLMKKTAYLINTARPEIVDEDALFLALKEKRIAGAALDVFSEEPLLPDNRFLQLENVICTPHIGGSTYDVIEHQTEMIVDSVEKYLKGEKIEYIYNPEVLKNG